MNGANVEGRMRAGGDHRNLYVPLLLALNHSHGMLLAANDGKNHRFTSDRYESGRVHNGLREVWTRLDIRLAPMQKGLFPPGSPGAF